MNFRPLLGAALSLVAGFTSFQPAFACSDFQIRAGDGSVIVGRTMEFDMDLQSQIVSRPRGQHFVSSSPDGKAGMNWQSKYGYVMVNALGLDFVTDGLNEKGLSFAYLWLPGSKYQEVTSAQDASAVEVADVGKYLLGNCATVDEAVLAMGKSRVWGKIVEKIGCLPPLHIALHDAAGGAKVVEFINGEQKIYDNPIGVLTNGPEFPEHLSNLCSYSHLSQRDLKTVQQPNGHDLSPFGAETKLLGLPGDFSPKSRFLRASALVLSARRAPDAQAGVNIAQHILNNLDYPQGAVRASTDTADMIGHNQWVVVKDLTDKVYYFRSYGNLNLQCVDLKKLNLNQGASVLSMPLQSKPVTADVSLNFQKVQ